MMDSECLGLSGLAKNDLNSISSRLRETGNCKRMSLLFNAILTTGKDAIIDFNSRGKIPSLNNKAMKLWNARNDLVAPYNLVQLFPGLLQTRNLVDQESSYFFPTEWAGEHVSDRYGVVPVTASISAPFDPQWNYFIAKIAAGRN
jgi:signal transduction histidine kinase